MSTANAKSRGYFKIAGAARAFNFDFKNKVVLDIGSSTGGFTEYALEKGARKVIAVEKGKGQMKSPLRDHPRLDLHEKTDIFKVRIVPPKGFRSAAARDGAREPRSRPPLGTRTTRGVDGRERRDPLVESIRTFPDTILADVSFIPLTKVLKYAKLNLSRSHTDFLVMLKPQFETTNPNDLVRGVVKNETIRRKIIKNFERWLGQNDFLIIKKHDNEQKGRHGNTERFYWLKTAS